MPQFGAQAHFRKHNYGISNNTVKGNIRLIAIRRNNWMFATA
jgi:hypothetical protein